MKTKVLLIAIIAAALVAITIGSIAIFINSTSDGKFPQNTFIAAVNISQKTLPEAKVILKAATDQYLEKKINIELLGKTKAIAIKDLGLQILSNETLEALEKQPEAKLSVIINHESLINFLEKTFKFENLKPKSATFFFDPKGKLSIKDSQAGLVIDEQDLLNQLKSNAQTLLTKDLLLKTTNQEASVAKAILEAQQDNIKQALDFQFTLLDPVYTGNWDLRLKNHLEWVSFAQKQQVSLPFLNQKFYLDPQPRMSTPTSPSENTIAIEINQDKLNEYIDTEISKWLDRPAEPVKIYTDASGKVVIEGKGSAGKKVQRKQLKQAIELAVANRIPKVTIPVVNIEPTVTISQDLQDKGIKDVIGVGHTSYYGSHPGRLINVKTGASKFNGLLIAPGEVFNFNSHLGSVDATTGFVKELVITADGTVPEYGGGICQVSTTFYRAALFTGLPIVERNEHSYVVSYYSQILGDGLDATIYLGGPNLKFKNDTNHYMLIQTYTEANDFELYVVFYGTNDGRKVTLEGPYLSAHTEPGPTIYIDDPSMQVGEEKQVEKNHVGFNVLWYRHITDTAGKLVTEEIKTNYKAIPAKIKRGTAVPEPAPVAPGTAPVTKTAPASKKTP